MIQSKERNSHYKLFPPNFPPKNSGKGVFLNNKTPHIVVNLVRSTQYVVFLAPPVGLEPTTLRLTAACSTD